MAATFHALWFPGWSLQGQRQPSTQPQDKHYHRATMLHINQSLTVVKESAHDQNNHSPHTIPTNSPWRVPRSREEVKHHGHSQVADLEFRLCATEICKLRPGGFPLTMSVFFVQSTFHGGCHGNMGRGVSEQLVPVSAKTQTYG